MNSTVVKPNFGNIGGIEFLHQNMAYLVPYVICYSLTTIYGILGNLLIIFTIITVKEMHSTANMLIFNLAIIDFFICSFVDSFTVAGVLLGLEFFNDYLGLCQFIAAFCLLLCVGSMANIGLLAINRYIHICHYKTYNKIFTKRNTIMLCVSIWVIGALIDLPNSLGWGGHVYDLKSLSCVWNRLANHGYSIFFPTTSILIPSLCIFFCYLRIFCFVMSSKNKINPSSNHNNAEQKSIKQETGKSIRLAKSLFSSFMLFVICWIPYGTIVMVDFGDTLPAWVHAFSTFVAHANSSLNPILYAKFNPLFSKGYKTFLNKITFGRAFKIKQLSNSKSTKQTTGNNSGYKTRNAF